MEKLEKLEKQIRDKQNEANEAIRKLHKNEGDLSLDVDVIYEIFEEIDELQDQYKKTKLELI